ncbi:MAG: hypothetical protein ACK4GN_17205 [Runella sp.]
MKTLKNYRSDTFVKRSTFSFDSSAWLAGLTLAIFLYILIYFLYPMISRGLLF